MSRPWAARAIELEPKEGHFSDYAAFLEWFDNALTSGPWDCLRDSIEAAEPNGMIPIYSLMCDAYDQGADKPLVLQCEV